MKGLERTDIALLIGLVLVGGLCAIGGVLYLPLVIGSVELPVSALVFGGLLAGVSVAAYRLTGDRGSAAAPVLAFFLVFGIMMMGIPGQNVFVQDWRVLLLAACALLLPLLAMRFAGR